MSTTLNSAETTNEEISVKKKKEFEVKMDANPTTGYQWRLVSINKEMIDSVSMKYTSNCPKGKMMMGCGGYDTWTFKAKKKEGVDTLVFHYIRPWEKDSAPEVIHTVKVTIK